MWMTHICEILAKFLSFLKIFQRSVILTLLWKLVNIYGKKWIIGKSSVKWPWMHKWSRWIGPKKKLSTVCVVFCNILVDIKYFPLISRIIITLIICLKRLRQILFLLCLQNFDNYWLHTCKKKCWWNKLTGYHRFFSAINGYGYEDMEKIIRLIAPLTPGFLFSS